VPRLSGGVAQRLAELIDSGVQAVVEIDKRVFAPQALAQFIPRYKLGGFLQQHQQQLKRLGVKLTLTPCLRSSPATSSTSNGPKRNMRLVTSIAMSSLQ
jgi:hypothetical protein